MMFTGCVIPPSLSVDTTDAGLNSPPSIVSVESQNLEMAEWQRYNFEQGTGTLNLVVYDTDVGDILRTKVFVNYTLSDPKPARADCTDAGGDTVARTSTCPLSGLCQNTDVASKEILTMQVVVFDKEVIPGLAPLYMGMNEGGLSTSRTFFITCQPKET